LRLKHDKVLDGLFGGISESVDIVRLVLLATVIASPLAWMAMNRWSGDFAYRAAMANPVKSLRMD
jgi:hypothetical protein